MQPRLDTMSGSRAKQMPPAASAAVAASNREVEDLALEDLREAINQVVFLQNVRATLMDEIKSLKSHAAEQDDALKRALAAVQDGASIKSELISLREELAKANKARSDAESKAGFAEQTLAIAAMEKEALAAQLEAVQCDVAALQNHSRELSESLHARDSLLSTQNASLSALQDANAQQESDLKQAHALEKTLRAELKQLRAAVESTASQSEAVRRAERDMLEKQLSQLQAEAIRLNTELGVASARLADADTTTNATKSAASAREAEVARLTEQLQSEISTTAAARKELEACRAELGAMQSKHTEWGIAVKAELENTQRELQNARASMAQRDIELEEQRMANQKLGADLADVQESLRARNTEAESLRAGMAEAAAREKQLQSTLADHEHSLKRWQNLHPDSQPGTPTHSMSPSRPRSPGTLAAELDNERSRAKVLEARLLKKEAEAFASGGDRAQLEEKLAAYVRDADKSNAELSKLRAQVKAVESGREGLELELQKTADKASSAAQSAAKAQAEADALRERIAVVEAELESAREAAQGSAELQELLRVARADTQRLTAECADADQLRANLAESTRLAAALQSKVDDATSAAAFARDRNASLQTELTAARSELDDSRRELVALQRQAESDAVLAEQKRKHQDDLLQDARTRVEKLEVSLREARADGEAELQRAKEKLDRLNGDYLQCKAEVTSVEKHAKEVARELSDAKSELAEARLAANKLTFEAERMREELDELKPRAAKLTEELQAERKGRKKAEKERAQAQMQLAGLQEVVETQQTHGRALVEQLREVGQANSRAAALEQANTALEAELRAVQADLEEREAHFTITVDKMREEARQESERHAESHEGLVAMLETLKKELYAHTKKNSALNQELGQKDNRLDDALGEVNTLRVRCDDLARDKAALEAAVAKAEAELAEAKEAVGQTQESAHIANALGSDTGLMRQLLEARQEVSRLKRELEESASSSSQPARAGTVDIKHKIQLSQAQAQVKSLQQENERLKAELEGRRSE